MTGNEVVKYRFRQDGKNIYIDGRPEVIFEVVDHDTIDGVSIGIMGRFHRVK